MLALVVESLMMLPAAASTLALWIFHAARSISPGV